MPTVHMVFGPVGAGKTTYARKFSNEIRAAFFSIDDWMANLYWQDAPDPPQLEWALERTGRCERQIWKTCRELLALGQDVVVELGFFKREQRDRFCLLAAEAGATAKLHYVTADREVRRARVAARNQGSETLTVQVDETTFDWAESWFQAPDEDELADCMLVTT
jgi:predicted kinase